MASRLPELTSGTLDFVRSRRKESGGYGATPMLPATVEDTYHALRIFAALGKPIVGNDPALLNYLSRLRGMEWTGARTAFHYLAACRMAKVPFDTDRMLRYVQQRLDSMHDLSERYYCARIAGEVLDLPDISSFTSAGGRYERPVWRDVTELWMHIYLKDGKHAGPGSLRKEDLISWLQACQNSDGGFGFLPGTTSFIENTYAGLRALAHLGSAPRNPDGCRSFLESGRTGNGGFARASKAMAFLYSTWHGIAALTLLKAL